MSSSHAIFNLQPLYEMFLAERTRWILWVPFCLAIGAVIYFQLTAEPSLWLTTLLLLLGGIQAFFAHRTDHILWRIVSIVFLLGVVGFASGHLRTLRMDAPVLEYEMWGVYVSGQIEEIQPLPKADRIILANVDMDRLDADKTPKKIRLQSYHFKDKFDVGDFVRVKAVLRPPPGPVAPGEFDFQRMAYFMQLGAIGFTLGEPTLLAHPPQLYLTQKIEQLRHKIGEKARDTLEDPATGAVAAALMTGQRTSIPKDDLQAFRDAGLSHLLAISGLHMGLITGLIFTALRTLMCCFPGFALRHPVKKIAAVGALIGGLFYLLIAGAPVPTQRAFIMIMLVFIAVLLDRKGISLRLVAFAAMVILLYSPEKVLNPGFQMSFMAVTALISAYEVFNPKLQAWRNNGGPMRKAGIYLLAIIVTTLVAELATISLGIHHFNRVTTYNIVANLVAMPVVVFWVMPFIIVSFLAFPLGLAEWPLKLVGQGLDIIIEMSHHVTAWDGAVILVPKLPGWGIFLILFGILWLCLWKHRWRLAGCVPVVIGLTAIPLHHHPDVLISESARLVGVRDTAGRVFLTTTRAEKFTSDIWLESFGEADKHWMKDEVVSPMTCDFSACIYQKNSTHIAVVFHEAALREECERSNLVVSTIPVKADCPTFFIDQQQVNKYGSHAIWLEKGQPRTKSVAQVRGIRPWTAE